MRRRDCVLVVDFGAQYAQLIARRIRDAKVYSEIVAPSDLKRRIAAGGVIGLVLSGGPKSVYANDAPRIDLTELVGGVPMLGICYGAQLIADQLGGEVRRTGVAEFGRTMLRSVSGSVLLGELPEENIVWMSHNDVITAPPGNAVVTGSTDASPVAAFEDLRNEVYGVQFHPEVVHTERGDEILKRFLFEVCGASPSYTTVSVIDAAVEEIRARVGDERVLCGLSGGVDSAVAAALVHKAVGDKLVCVFVDHGLLRKGEAEAVVRTFRERMGMNLVEVKAADKFLQRLKGVTDPEEKRKAIGETFIRVFEEVARAGLGPDSAQPRLRVSHEREPASQQASLSKGELKEVPRFLVQGTLYPDIVESGTSQSATIKSHHNVGGLPETMDFELIEPLRNLFKDEVRRIGEELGLSEEIVWRQPFPGPGLAVRIIGEVSPERLEILREADAIVLEEIKRAGLYKELWQSFAVLPAIKSVGVMGDERTYAYPVIVRAVKSEDAMTADWARLPYEVLERIATRIINEVEGVNRVAYDISSKPPATIEWE
ncbi:MAG: GMP synthase (glutamine-hydrolyzing) [Acidimicrobiia bacterium]